MPRAVASAVGVDEGGVLHEAGLAVALEGPRRQRLRVDHTCGAEDQRECTDEWHVERDAIREYGAVIDDLIKLEPYGVDVIALR